MTVSSHAKNTSAAKVALWSRSRRDTWVCGSLKKGTILRFVKTGGSFIRPTRRMGPLKVVIPRSGPGRLPRLKGIGMKAVRTGPRKVLRASRVSKHELFKLAAAGGQSRCAGLTYEAPPPQPQQVEAVSGRGRRRIPRDFLDLGSGGAAKAWSFAVAHVTYQYLNHGPGERGDQQRRGGVALRAKVADLISSSLPRIPRGHCLEVLEEELTGCWAAIEYPSGAVVGCLVFRRAMNLEVLEVSFLAVAPTHRNRGIGAALCGRLKALGKKASSKLVTHADNMAVEYWARVGFSVAKIPKYLDKWLNHYDESTFMLMQV